MPNIYSIHICTYVPVHVTAAAAYVVGITEAAGDTHSSLEHEYTMVTHVCMYVHVRT